jgi:transcription elongation factor Elf1
MNRVRCPQCHALNVTIVSSDDEQHVVTIQCFECGAASEIDTEAFQVDIGDLPQE